MKNKNPLFKLNIQLFAEDNEDKPESEIVKFLKEEYEKKLADKDKIIKDLINGNKKSKKKQSIIEDDAEEDAEDEAEEDVEEKKKQEEFEKRKKWRMDYYKKHIH